MEHSGASAAIRPGESRDAVAGLTDHRMVFVVGDPAAYDGDFVRSLWHSELTDARVETESLTARVEVETVAGRRWSFTARETDTDDVAAFLAESRGNPTGPHPVARPLMSHCTVLTAHLERANWDAFDRRKETAWEALDRARTDCPDSPAGGVRDTVDRLARELHTLARDRHLRAGNAALSTARDRFDAGAVAAGCRNAQAAAEAFETARRLGKQSDIDVTSALTARAEAGDLVDTGLGRLLATGKMHRAKAAEQSAPERRVSTLETALDIYNTAATLVADDTVDGDVRSRTRSASERAIEALVEARLDAAAAHRATGNQELADGHPDRAERAYLEARDDIDRALELAESFPPGDADSIRTRREALTAQVASLSE